MNLSMHTMKAGMVPSRKKDIPAMIDRPMKTHVSVTQAVKDMSPWMMGILLSCLHAGQIAGEKDTENSFWQVEICFS